MASSCPKCHRVLEEDEICCAQIRYVWRCVGCFKLDAGDAIPYGKCFLCGGDLTLLADRGSIDGMLFQAVREAVRFELDAFRFFKAADERARTPEQHVVLERLCEAELDRLHEIEDRYHVHPEEVAVDDPISGPFRSIRIREDEGPVELYRLALELERRERERFQQLACNCPPGLENDLCRELAADEDEYIAALETELEQLTA